MANFLNRPNVEPINNLGQSTGNSYFFDIVEVHHDET